MTLQMIADVERIEQMKYGFKKFNPTRNNNGKIRAQWAGKGKIPKCTLVNQFRLPTFE